MDRDWRADGFELDVARHSPWSAFLGILGVGTMGYLAIVLGAVLVAVTGHLVALFLTGLLALGGAAGVATRLEQTLAVVDTVRVDPVRVEIGERSVPFERVTAIEWEREDLVLSAGREHGLRIRAPRLKASEREWLQDALQDLWRAHQARDGEVPRQIGSLLNRS